METLAVCLFGVQPLRIGGVESFTRELARQLAAKNAGLVAVFSRLPEGRVAEFLRLPNLFLEAIPGVESSSPATLAPLAALLRRYRPRILHLQFVNFISGYPWVARLCGVERVFFTAQGSNPAGYRARRAPFWKRAAVRLIDAPLSHVFCVSDYTRGALSAQDLLPAGRLSRIYNSIPVPRLEDSAGKGAAFRKRFGIPEDRDLIAQVSWIIPEKGIPDLLEAARLVLEERPNTHFAIVGDGAHADEYKQECQRMGIARSVTWTGLLENPMEDGVYAAADVFCLLSRWEEAFGWVLAEAMAFEKPVVATSVGGIPEVVSHERTGLLSRPEDPGAAAANLMRLLDDPGLRSRMGKAGRKAVEEKFDLRASVAEVVSFYQR
jgi:glycosyltransferase involved in cell wall biosynthesis